MLAEILSIPVAVIDESPTPTIMQLAIDRGLTSYDASYLDVALRSGWPLVTLDHDYLDTRRFPPAESTGVLVLEAPTPEAFERLLASADAQLFHRGAIPLPLEHQTRLLIPEPEA